MRWAMMEDSTASMCGEWREGGVAVLLSVLCNTLCCDYSCVPTLMHFFISY